MPYKVKLPFKIGSVVATPNGAGKVLYYGDYETNLLGESVPTSVTVLFGRKAAVFPVSAIKTFDAQSSHTEVNCNQLALVYYAFEYP